MIEKCLRCKRHFDTAPTYFEGYCETCELDVEAEVTYYESADDVDAWVDYQFKNEEDERNE